MKVTIEKSYPLPAQAGTAWTLLQDIEAVAGCMPGARITERIDASHYKGTVAVRLGPANMSFRGEVEVAAIEVSSRTLRLVGKGTDTTGSSGAAMDLTARVEATDADSCSLVGTTEVSMSGKAAAFGGRMAQSVADQVLRQFAANFATRAQALQAQSAAPEDGPAPSAAADAGALDGRAASTGPTAMPAAAASPPAAPAERLDGLALLWAVFKDWLRSLFGARRA